MIVTPFLPLEIGAPGSEWILLPKRAAAFGEGHKKSSALFQKICWEEPEKQRTRSCRAQELSRSCAQWRGWERRQCTETRPISPGENPSHGRENVRQTDRSSLALAGSVPIGMLASRVLQASLRLRELSRKGATVAAGAPKTIPGKGKSEQIGRAHV